MDVRIADHACAGGAAEISDPKPEARTYLRSAGAAIERPGEKVTPLFTLPTFHFSRDRRSMERRLAGRRSIREDVASASQLPEAIHRE
ncbi:MAG TPA: hypothetical protein VMO47_04090, partial [Rhodothermales bacterium]|nr:hypothetical protein [Rhodothermales bacterium]